MPETSRNTENVDALRRMDEVMGGDAERWPQDPRTPFGRLAMFLQASKWWDPNLLLGSSYNGRAEIVVSVGDLRAIFDELREARAGQPPLTDEYGLRATFLDTRTVEGAVADTLGAALDALADFDAKDRGNVLSRKLLQRKVTGWTELEQETDRG